MAKKPMTRKEIVAALAKEAGINLTQADAVLGSLVETCRQEVKSGNPFRLAGLGTFSLKHSAARNGVNPATGEPIAIPARNRMAFKSSPTVAELMNPGRK